MKSNSLKTLAVGLGVIIGSMTTDYSYLKEWDAKKKEDFQNKTKGLENAYGESVENSLNELYSSLDDSRHLSYKLGINNGPDYQVMSGDKVIRTGSSTSDAREEITSHMERILQQFIGTDIDNFDKEVSTLIKDVRDHVASYHRMKDSDDDLSDLLSGKPFGSIKIGGDYVGFENVDGKTGYKL